MGNYLEFIGLSQEEYTSRKENFIPANESISKKYLDYVNGLHNYQIQRQQTIENKTSQLIGQSSVVISIVSLFIPLFFDRLNNLNIIYKGALILFFVFVILHFVLSIVHATKMLEIDKYRFMYGATSTITKENRVENEVLFINQEIKDLVNIVNHNNGVTNKVAANLVYASRSFKIGIIGLTVFIQ